MIELLLTPFAFLLGTVLCFQALAACYASIDLWYVIEEHQVRIAVRVLAWSAAYLGTWWWLPGVLADAYAYGGWVVIITHVGICIRRLGRNHYSCGHRTYRTTHAVCREMAG